MMLRCACTPPVSEGVWLTLLLNADGPSRPSGSPTKRVSFVVIGLLAALPLAFAASPASLAVFEYSPQHVEGVEVRAAAAQALPARGLSVGGSLELLAWNTGHCGLPGEADFFMDGGSGVRTVPREGVRANLASIERAVAERGADVVFLQEVDRGSSRGHHIGEAGAMRGAFVPRGYSAALAPNYAVPFVPYPIPPIGAVDGGVVALLDPDGVTGAERIRPPCPFGWPIRLGNLKRCLLVERVPVKAADGGAREPALVSLHLEACDDGAGGEAQAAVLVDLMRSECDSGNCVVAGGGLNQTFSNAGTSACPLQGDGLRECGHIGAGAFGGGFALVMDPTVPTCRSLDRPYDAADPTFQYYMIDGFIVSANVRVDARETIGTAFDFSDHNPVQLGVTLL